MINMNITLSKLTSETEVKASFISSNKANIEGQQNGTVSG